MASWRAIFLINVPAGALAAFAVRFVPATWIPLAAGAALAAGYAVWAAGALGAAALPKGGPGDGSPQTGGSARGVRGDEVPLGESRVVPPRVTATRAGGAARPRARPDR